MLKQTVLMAGVLVACSVHSAPPENSSTNGVRYSAAPTPPGVEASSSVRPYYSVNTNDWKSGASAGHRERAYYAPVGVTGTQSQEASTHSRCYRTPDGTVCNHGFGVSNDAEVRRYGSLLSNRKSDQKGGEDMRFPHGGDRYAEGMVHVEQKTLAAALASTTQSVADLRGIQDGLDRVFTVLQNTRSYSYREAPAIIARFKAARSELTSSLNATTPLKIAATPNEGNMQAALKAAGTMSDELQRYFVYHSIAEPLRSKLWIEVKGYEAKLGPVVERVRATSKEVGSVQAELERETRENEAGNAVQAPVLIPEPRPQAIPAVVREPANENLYFRDGYRPGVDTRNYSHIR